MKRISTIVLLIVIAIIGNNMQAQPWNSLLPKDKVENGKLTFYDHQKAFNDYWAPKNVENGYYTENGEKIKAGGWKQFKRWEWYWENRVDPRTGAFPNMSAIDIIRKQNKNNSGVKSQNGQWTSMGPSNSSGGYAGLGRLNCIGFHPTDNNTLYAGSASGGVWKSTDGGSNWIVQANELDAIGISDIIVQSTTGDDIVFIATGDRDASDTYSVGVMKSTDGGTSWSATGLVFTAGQKRLINRLLVDPTNSNTFYAATSVGVYKSTDGCATWTQISGEIFIDMEFKPGVPNIIYGSTKQGAIHRTIDSGSTWSQSFNSSGKRTELAVSANDATIVYALIANSSSELFGIYKSTNSGSSFSLVYNSLNLLGWSCDGSGSGGQGWYDLAIAADPTDVNTVFIGGVNTWKSTDGGSSWSINNHWSSTCSGQATTVHADKHNLTYQNGTSTLFECNDGGLYSTSNGGNTWSHLTNGMVISQIYRLGVAQTTTQDVIIGLQDNGTKALLTSTWNDVRGGDGMECLIDYSDENTQYASIYYGNVVRTTNHWASSTNITGSITGNAAWVTPYVQDPNTSNTLYIGYQDVWKSTNRGDSWTQISSWGGNTLRSLAVAPSNSSYIYAATTSTLYGTSNGGTTWSTITGSLPTGSSNITYISVKDDDPQTLWVSMGEFNNYCVYESTDGGSNWTDISAGLPSLPTNCVIQNRQNTTDVELYAGTDVGVYVKIGAANWAPYSNNLPNVVVNELEIYYDDVTPSNSLLRAATYGRGLWESDLYSLTTTLEANFTANNTSIEVGQQVIFTDLSTGSPTTWDWTFTGGNPATHSGQTPPPVQYDTEGTYDVTLIVSDGTDYDTLTKTDYITVTNCTVSTFPYLEDFENGGLMPLCWTEEFISGNNVSWQFLTGNGGSNPSNAHSGIYNACLSDSDTDEDKTILVSPPFDLSGFTSAQVRFWHTQEFWSPDQDELKVFYRVDATSAWIELTSYTNSIASWTQDTIDLPNLSSSYYIGFEGNALYGYGVCIDDVEIIGDPNSVDADFSADITSGYSPLLVNFTDLSTGPVISWDWDFGDGNTSTDQNPSNEYTAPGLYTVTLTVTGSNGSDTETKTDYIEVLEYAPVADFTGDPEAGNVPLIVDFTDLSTGPVDSWNWDFGDGNTSTSQNPQHTYGNVGVYSVTLIVSGPGGQDSLTKTDYITVIEEQPMADFEGSPTTGEAPLMVNFTDLSTGVIDTWDWQFGDGETSSEQNPSHEYTTPGNFTVSLEVTGPGGTSGEIKTDYILIPVGTNEIINETVLVYPIPAQDKLNIKFIDSENRTIHLKNLSGKSIIKKVSDTDFVSFNVSTLSSGVYTLEIVGSSGSGIVKVIIE